MANNPPDNRNISNILFNQVSPNVSLHTNIDQSYIMITEDKLRLCLHKHLSKVEKRKAWVTPLGIFLTIIIVFPTTNFKDALTIHENTWESIFIIAALLTGVWLIKSIIEARGQSSDLNILISDISAASDEKQ